MTTTRRTFLKVVGAGASAVCVGGMPLGCPAGPTGVIAAGNVSDLTVGQVKQVDGEGVLVGLDAGGVYAMTAICTHLGCDISGPDGSIDADGVITCHCHGSEYNPDGTNKLGPASQPLKHLKVTLADNGDISVDGAAEVGADERVAVGA